MVEGIGGREGAQISLEARHPPPYFGEKTIDAGSAILEEARDVEDVVVDVEARSRLVGLEQG
jgi:hypothetical protein